MTDSPKRPRRPATYQYNVDVTWTEMDGSLGSSTVTVYAHDQVGAREAIAIKNKQATIVAIRRVARPKPKSRSDRASEAAGELRAAAEVARVIAAAVRDVAENQGTSDTVPAADLDAAMKVADAVMMEDAATNGFNVLEELASEMGEWRDNIEEKFSATQKYEDVSAAADQLEDISEEDVPDALDTTEPVTVAEAEEYADALESWADDLDGHADTAEGVEFPGMF